MTMRTATAAPMITMANAIFFSTSPPHSPRVGAVMTFGSPTPENVEIITTFVVSLSYSPSVGAVIVLGSPMSRNVKSDTM